MFESFSVYRMSAPSDSNAARILVADDQPDVLEALRWLLTGEGTRRSSSARGRLPIESMKDAMLASVDGFTGGRFADDATLIVVGL